MLLPVHKCLSMAVGFSNWDQIPKADVSEILLCRHDGDMCENVGALLSIFCLYAAYSDGLQRSRCKHIYTVSIPQATPALELWNVCWCMSRQVLTSGEKSSSL